MAKYESWEDRRELQVGEEVWAYMLCENTMREELNQKPVKGMIGHDSLLGNFFAPFKDGSTIMDLTKVVRLDLRNYADTEEEAIEGYNELIDNLIGFHNDQIKKLEGLKINAL